MWICAKWGFFGSWGHVECCGGNTPCIDQSPRYSCQFRGWLLKQNSASADSGDMVLELELDLNHRWRDRGRQKSPMSWMTATMAHCEWLWWWCSWLGWTLSETGCGVILWAKYHKLRCVAAITKSTNHADMSFSEIKLNHSHEQTTAVQTGQIFYSLKGKWRTLNRRSSGSLGLIGKLKHSMWGIWLCKDLPPSF